MTVPEDDDRSVLDILGFGAPAALPAVPARETSAELVETTAPVETALAPLTRRALRERERSVEPAAPRRGAPSGSAKVRAPRRTKKNTMRRDAVRTAGRSKTIGKRLLSFGAALFAGALALGMSVPANAFVDWTSASSASKLDLAQSFAMEGQSIEVDPTLVSFSERDGWTVTSWAEMLRLRYGTRSFDYTIGAGPIRWPFPFAVPISSGFGDRAAPCRGCSTAHSGIDFTPGAGAAIFAIADGTVVDVSSGGSSWGHYVVIEHQIDGQTVYSGYAHMQSASSPLVVGEQIKVGDFVGLVGATGQATGAHLHFTIAIGERMHYVDPFTFLKQYAS
jgi:Membrane proteins related to metalloendopeptidases